MKSYLLYEKEKQIEQNGENACVVFRTNAARFSLEYTVTDKKAGNYPHVGITAQEGLAVLYRRCKDGICSCWYPVDLLSKVYQIEVNMSHMIKDREMYEILIYGPILAHLARLFCVLKDEDFFAIPEYNNRKRCLILGGCKTFGIGVTSTGMMFGNILRREMLDCMEIQRVAFREKNYLDLIAAQVTKMDLSVYDLVIFEVDTYGQNDQVVEKQLPIIMEQIAESVEKVICWYSLPKREEEKKQQISFILDRWKDNQIRFLNMNHLFSPMCLDTCTYSLNFINDAGNILIYKALRHILEEQWSI